MKIIMKKITTYPEHEISFIDFTSSKERLFRRVPKYRDFIRALVGISIAVCALTYAVALIDSNVLKSAEYKNLIKYHNVNGFTPVK